MADNWIYEPTLLYCPGHRRKRNVSAGLPQARDLALGGMSSRTDTALVFGRWALIVSELLLGGYLVATQLTGRHAHRETGAFLVVGILAFVAWVFLFFGSPFLVRSQRWLAILGWCIAVAAIFFPVL